MLHLRDLDRIPTRKLWQVLLLTSLLVLVLPGTGCKGHSHTSDPQLRSIDQLLEKSFPPGTPRVRIDLFIASRGYAVEPSSEPRTLVAVIRHIDTDTLQPVTARVTFHFDAADRLTTYDLVRVPDAPIHP